MWLGVTQGILVLIAFILIMLIACVGKMKLAVSHQVGGMLSV